MTQLGNLQFDNNSFDFNNTNIYGIFEPHGYMTWHIELFPAGEDNYIMFNSLIFDNIVSPQQLSDMKYKADGETEDLLEHTVRVNGQDRFLKSVDMTFGKWDTTKQSIQLKGSGTIISEKKLPKVEYTFNTNLKFKGIYIFGTSKEYAEKFVDMYFLNLKDRIKINFENVPSGLEAIISGQF